MKILGNKEYALICLPYAGGSSTYYNRWRQFLPPNIEMCIYELAGRGARASVPTIYKNLDDIVKDLFSQMDADNLFCRPYYLFGHSLGALITIKLCDLIRRKEKALPIHLFVSGEGAPIHTREHKKIHMLNDQDFIYELKKLGGITDDFFLFPELQEYYLPILRNDLKIAETAVFDTIIPFDFNLSVLIGKEDVWTSDQIFKWNDYTNGICNFHFFQGGHFYLSNYGKEITHIISHCL